MSPLRRQIVEQALCYFNSHIVEFSGVADCAAVSAKMAVDGAIEQMFDNDCFNKRRNAKLVRRLYVELFPRQPIDQVGKHDMVIQTEVLYAEIRELLASDVKEKLYESSRVSYEDRMAERSLFARDLRVHPDPVPAYV